MPIVHKCEYDQRVFLRFCRLKVSTAAEAAREAPLRPPEVCKITHIVYLSASEYDHLINNLQESQEWISAMGGSAVDYEPPATPWYEWSESELERFRREGYQLVVEIIGPERPTVYINPEGHDHPRYIGFPQPPGMKVGEQ